LVDTIATRATLTDERANACECVGGEVLNLPTYVLPDAAQACLTVAQLATVWTDVAPNQGVPNGLLEYGSQPSSSS
jgi:hypothetical protein